MPFSGYDTVEVLFFMQRTAMPLPTISVREKASVPMNLLDFERRRMRGFGHFLVDTTLAFVLETALPGVRAVYDQRLARYVLASTATFDLSGRPCRIMVYRDGMRDPEGDLTFLNPNELAGVEFYTTAEAPSELRRADSPLAAAGSRGLPDGSGGVACGVLAIWTKQAP